PERRPDGHRHHLGVAALTGVRGARLLVLLGQARIERPAEVHVARVPAGADVHALLALYVDLFAHVAGGDAKHPPRPGALADDAGHRMLQQDLHARLARAFLEPSDEPGPVPPS